MAKHRGFQNAEEYFQLLKQNWNKIITKKDLTYILGDVTMETDKFYHLLNELNGRKIVVLGNHDKPKHVRTLLQYVETVAGMIDYKGFVLTHCPIHPDEIPWCRGNIHAHIHHNELSELEATHYDNKTKHKTLEKYFNVDAHKIGFIPKTLQELLKNNKYDKN